MLEPHPLEESPLATGRTDAIRHSMLRASRELLTNRLVLAALGLVTVLLLVAVVFSAIGNGARGPAIRVALPATTAPTSAPALRLNGGLLGRMLETVSVRNGPNAHLLASILGTVPRGAVVAVVGRNKDKTWLQIVYPIGSDLRGWVDARYVNVTGDVSALAIAGPGREPAVALPTSPPPLVGRRAPPTLAPEPTRAQPTTTPSSPPTATRTLSPTRTPATPAPRRSTATPAPTRARG